MRQGANGNGVWILELEETLDGVGSNMCISFCSWENMIVHQNSAWLLSP